MPYLQHMEGNLILFIVPFEVIEDLDLLSFLVIRFEVTVPAPQPVLVFSPNLFSDLQLASPLWTLMFDAHPPDLQNSLLNRVGDSYFRTLFLMMHPLWCVSL